MQARAFGWLWHSIRAVHHLNEQLVMGDYYMMKHWMEFAVSMENGNMWSRNAEEQKNKPSILSVVDVSVPDLVVIVPEFCIFRVRNRRRYHYVSQ